MKVEKLFKKHDLLYTLYITKKYQNHKLNSKHVLEMKRYMNFSQRLLFIYLYLDILFLSVIYSYLAQIYQICTILSVFRDIRGQVLGPHQSRLDNMFQGENIFLFMYNCKQDQTARKIIRIL